METLIANKKWLVDNSLRLDASFYMSDGIKTILVFNKSKNEIKPLSEVTESIFYGGRDKRNYVTNPEAGIPFIKGADITLADFSKLKTISRKRTRNLNSYFLEEEWILVTRSGTVGNTAYVNKDFIGKAASDDIIRIIPKGIKSGYLYAYLTSKYGNALITHGKYGAVIQHIEPEHIAHIPVPIFPQEKQEQIHNLITEAAKLRVEANRLLEEAHVEICTKVGISKKKKSLSAINSSQIRDSFSSRLEASFYNCEGTEIENNIKENFSYKLLNEVSEKIFRPGIFKRNYINKGINFLGGSDIIKAIPKSDKYLSLTKTKNIKELIIEKGWILVTCGGTIGNTVFVDTQLAECAISQHVLRIIPKDIYGGYLFAFLSSSIGYELINKYVYGSVIPQIEPQHIGLIPIPLLNNELMKEIDKNILLYANKLEKAKSNENQAISLVENEIALWQS